MVAQLGNDLAGYEQQQQPIGAIGAGAEQAHQPIGAMGAGAEHNTGTAVGVDSSAMSRASSAHSFVSQWNGMGDQYQDTVLSDSSLTVSPDAKRSNVRSGPSRAGARSLSTSTRTKSTRPMTGRFKSGSPARPPRMTMKNAGAADDL